ncbi:hypothetical protein Pfo_016407 [Paulownia fortunei]|nr:hypothetical protein Pfo_016407 [Paulownia fortunei]
MFSTKSGDVEDHVTLDVEPNTGIGTTVEPSINLHVATQDTRDDVDPEYKPDSDYDTSADLTLRYAILHKMAIRDWTPTLNTTTIVKGQAAVLFCVGTGIPINMGHSCLNPFKYAEGLNKQKGDEMERKLLHIKVTLKLVKGHTPPAPVDSQVVTTNIAANIDYIQFLKKKVQDIHKIIQELYD